MSSQQSLLGRYTPAQLAAYGLSLRAERSPHCASLHLAFVATHTHAVTYTTQRTLFGWSAELPW